ncbi:MAG: response regulator transcription factor [Bacteroidia bacterium]|nr:response regulator transcription factor [Bacteroidia bacterium]
MLRCIIVDDEPIAIGILEKYISKFQQFILIGTCKSVRECKEILRTQKVDLLFLDIEMPGMTGLQFLKSLENPPLAIFTTAHREFAIEGYELNVVDYLLKPIPFNRFECAIKKSIERFESRIIIEENKIYVKSGTTVLKLTVKDIIYIEGMGNYIRLHFSSGRPTVIYQKMSEIPNILNSNNFVRIHRSYFIALDKVSSYTNTHIYINGNELPIGVSYKSEIKKLLDNLKNKG